MRRLAALAMIVAFTTPNLTFAASSNTVAIGQGLPARVQRVQQYEDRMPTSSDSGAPVPARIVTLIDFEIESCKAFQEEDFEVRVQQEGGNQLAQIRPAGVTVECSGPAYRQKFTIGTTTLLASKSVVITNPVLIEQVPAAY